MPRHLNVARVVLDNPLPHLDRLFDYEIPEEFDEACVPGVKVKVKFSNRNMEAWVCLLYTSPSPRDLSTSRMPSSA